MVLAPYISLLGDQTLGCILLFLWIIRRDDRHALLWGAGQVLIGLATYAGVLDAGSGSMLPLAILSCAAGITCTISGTQYLRGKNTHWLLNLLGWWALSTAIASVKLGDAPIAVDACEIVLAAALGWCAWNLHRHAPAFRLLGAILALRTVNDVYGAAMSLSGQSTDTAFMFAFALKASSAMVMIYCVMKANHERSMHFMNGLGHGFLIRNKEGVILHASKKLADYVGFASEKLLIGKNLADLAADRPRERLIDWFRHVNKPGTPLPCIDEANLLHAAGNEIPVEFVSLPYEERGQKLLMTQVFDIRERKRLEAERNYVAMLDEHTGLFNSTLLRKMLTGLLSSGADSNQPTALLLIDIDKFQRINDTLGHTTGDRVLRLFATRLLDLQGPNDMLARFGGDKFAFVPGDLGQASMQLELDRLARAILKSLDQPFHIDSFRILLKASIGIAIAPEHGRDAETLLSAANTALHRAKDAGRSRYFFFTQVMGNRSRDSLLIDEALLQAIDNNELKLVYQPIIESHTGRIIKAEALLRWTHPQMGSIAPDRFIPIAEESGQILGIGAWVLQEAARQAAAWASDAIPVRVSVNVSAAQITDNHFLNIVDNAIRLSGATPEQLEMEMTERVLIDEKESVVRVIDALHEKGFSTSLDDFGTGYSSLSYLTHFRLRTLKIDKAFVAKIEHDKRSLALANAIIAMGHSLGMQIVAEGVETIEQARILASLGCEYLQGYLISRPVSAEELHRLARDGDNGSWPIARALQQNAAARSEAMAHSA